MAHEDDGERRDAVAGLEAQHAAEVAVARNGPGVVHRMVVGVVPDDASGARAVNVVADCVGGHSVQTSGRRHDPSTRAVATGGGEHPGHGPGRQRIGTELASASARFESALEPIAHRFQRDRRTGVGERMNESLGRFERFESAHESTGTHVVECRRRPEVVGDIELEIGAGLVEGHEVIRAGEGGVTGTGRAIRGRDSASCGRRWCHRETAAGGRDGSG